MNTHELISMTKNVVRKTRGKHDRRIMHPSRDWLLGLCIGVFVVVIGGAWSTYTYFFYEKQNAATVDGSESMVTYNARMVEDALARYAARQTRYAAALTNTATSSSATTSPVATVATTSTSSTVDTSDGPEAPDTSPNNTTPMSGVDNAAEVPATAFSTSTTEAQIVN